MTGTIQGQSVTWETRNPTHAKNLAILEGVYQANPVTQDLGPRTRLLTLRAWLDPPDMDYKVRTIHDLIAYTGLIVITDPANIFYDDAHAFIRVGSAPVDRKQRRTSMDFSAAYIGNNRSHRVGLLATSKHLPNVWGLPGLTALKVPAGCTLESEILTDAVRRVIRTPTYFQDFDAEYVSDGVDRNSGALTACHADTPENLLQDIVHCLVAGLPRYGFGYDLTQGIVRNVSMDAFLDAAQAEITFTDRLLGQSNYSLEVAAYTRATHGDAQMPSTPTRHTILLNSGLKLTSHANGNIHVRPFGGLMKAPGGATRALGTGVFYYSPAANFYITCTVDFTVAADGTIGYGVITYGPELVVNGGFEAYTTSPGVPDSWTSMGGAGVVFEKDSLITHGGYNSVKVTAGGASDQGLKQVLAGLSAGVLTFVEVRARTGGGGSEQARLIIRNTTDAVDVAVIDGTVASTNWQRLFASFTPQALKVYEARLVHAAGAANRVIYFDDAGTRAFSSQAATGDVDAVFGFVYSLDAGAALTNRLLECLNDQVVDWVPEAR